MFGYDGHGSTRVLTDLAGAVATVAGVRQVFTYDDAGNTLTVTVDGILSTTYTYDLEGRLVHAVTGGHTSDYTYDDAGHRTSKTVDGQTTTYLNDPNQAYDQVLEEYAPGGVLAATYVRGLDLIFQDRPQLGGSVVRSYYVKDGLGSTRALTDQAGAVTDTYTYDAYGNLIGSTGTTTNEFLFAGYQHDTATGLAYLRARYYYAAAGRFTSRDTFDGRPSDPSTLNHYIYAGANPVNNIDPSGHNFTLPSLNVTMAIGAGLGAFVGGVDAALGKPSPRSIAAGIIVGAASGAAFAAAAWYLPGLFTSTLFQYAGAALTLSGIADSLQNEHYFQAIFRGITGLSVLNKLPKFASYVEALDVIKSVKTLFGIKPTSNVAYLDINVKGYFGRLFAVNGYNKIPKAGKVVQEPLSELFVEGGGAGRFFTFSVKGKPRASDSEVKLLSYLDSLLGGDSNATGTIRLVSERMACGSCQSVIDEFMSFYPKIELEIVQGGVIPR